MRPGGAAAPPRAAPRIGRRLAGELQAVERPAQVQPGAADEDRHAPARRDVVHRGPRASDWYSATAADFAIGHTSSRWCATPPRSSGGQLRRADVHAGVELHRVGVDDLAVQALRERHGEVGLAGRCRSDDRDDPRRTGSAASRPSRHPLSRREVRARGTRSAPVSPCIVFNADS